MGHNPDCVCMGGDFMPTDIIDTCKCLTAPWLPQEEWVVTPGCTHPTEEIELVCRKHLKHEPCRPCMKEED